MKKKTKSPIVSYEQMEIGDLLKSAVLAAGTIKSGIMELGEILFHISCRYNDEGITLACETLGLQKPLAQRFIAAYRGVLHPDIALGTVPFSNRLEKLTRAEQNDIIKNGYTLMERIKPIGKLSGRLKATKIPVAQLDSTQVSQLFDGPRLRNEAEQTQYLKSNEDATQATKARVAIKTWEIKDNKMVVHKPLSFSKKDLQGILKRLK